MKIAVFDIDGTLTSTNHVDGHYFAVSVGAVLEIALEPDWSRFSEATDAAILAELCAECSSRSYAEVEAEVQQHFFGLLEATVRRDPTAFRPICGAERILAAVRCAGWTPVIATGGWRRSAEIKLSAAGIVTTGVPFASCSDHSDRVAIVREAVRGADPTDEASGVVVVGDGLWDLRASQALRFGFVGRAEGEAARSLLSHGARAVVPHFADSDSFISVLERALQS
jgi:phosphoglycolate phosphatase-like HAD superfamily hydrolase